MDNYKTYVIVFNTNILDSCTVQLQMGMNNGIAQIIVW